MKDLVDIELPFSGFYNTVHQFNIDNAVEGGFNYDYETGEEKEVPEVLWDADIDYHAIELEYCQEFVDSFSALTGLELSFDEMTSPKDYNYKTDRLFCKVPRQQIDKIRKEVEAHKDWAQYVHNNYTSYDGFWSNYDNDIKHEDWTKETLDECQYESVLKFWLRKIKDIDWDDVEGQLVEVTDEWESVDNAQSVIEKYLKEVGYVE